MHPEFEQQLQFAGDTEPRIFPGRLQTRRASKRATLTRGPTGRCRPSSAPLRERTYGNRHGLVHLHITDPNAAGLPDVQQIVRTGSGTAVLTATTASYTYDTFGRVSTVTNSDGYTISYFYDNLNRVTMVSYPDGTKEPDDYHRLDAEWTSDRLGRWTHHVYDRLRHQTDVYDPLNRHRTSIIARAGHWKGSPIQTATRPRSFQMSSQG